MGQSELQPSIGAVHSLWEGIERASRGPLCCNTAKHSGIFPPSGEKCLEGCWNCPFGDGHGATGAPHALASLPVLIRKDFSSLKISSWCLLSADGNVCLICNLNLIAKAS